MLGLGWTEMLVIGVVALIFIGPKDLPVVMGRVGKVIGQIQRMGREFQREINKTTGLDEVRNLRSSITAPLKKTADEIRKDFNAIGQDGKVSPTGVLKPTDPNTESVVEAIQQQAGMAPAKKSADELAADYGFKSSKAEPAKTETAKSEPVKAARSPAKPATAKSEPAAATPKAAAKPKSATKAPAAKAATKPAAKTGATDAAAAEAPAPKAAGKRVAPKAAKPAAAATETKPAAKPRAPRKKPVEAAGKSE